MSLTIPWLFLGQNMLDLIPYIIWNTLDSGKMFLFVLIFLHYV
jgi:hypothetical protein